VIPCQVERIWSCQRLTAGTVAHAKASPVTISHEGIVFATGRLLSPGHGRIRFLVTEQQPLVPGSYDVVIQQPGHWQQAISIARGPAALGPARPSWGAGPLVRQAPRPRQRQLADPVAAAVSRRLGEAQVQFAWRSETTFIASSPRATPRPDGMSWAGVGQSTRGTDGWLPG